MGVADKRASNAASTDVADLVTTSDCAFSPKCTMLLAVAVLRPFQTQLPPTPSCSLSARSLLPQCSHLLPRCSPLKRLYSLSRSNTTNSNSKFEVDMTQYHTLPELKNVGYWFRSGKVQGRFIEGATTEQGGGLRRSEGA